MIRKENYSIEMKLEYLKETNEINAQSKIIIFGVSDRTIKIISYLKELGIPPIMIIDNDKEKQGTMCCGIPVVEVERIVKEYDEEYKFIVFSFYAPEMIMQLKECGYSEKDLLNIFPKRKRFYTFRLVLQGKRIYQRIMKGYSKEAVFMLCPYSGTGDIFLLGTFLKQYIEKNNISNYVMVVISTPCRKVAQMFGIENVVQISPGEVEPLLELRTFSGGIFPIKIMNDSFVYTNTVQWLRGYKGLNFTDMLRYGVFEFEDDVKPVLPQNTGNRSRVLELFKEKGLIPGKTIVFSPYANTLTGVDPQFWETLAMKYSEKGYTICTNSCGDKEPVIKGTKGVFFSLEDAALFMDTAGYFIGLRSGLCDIISASSCKKVVIYNKYNRFFNSRAYEYFSLKSMGLTQEVLEIEYEIEKQEEQIEQIESYFSGM